ncbi:MAG: phosphohistidine phosphatase SixA [Verrucomicrobia bacterium]|nr:phosphohistidine phosphatase SixA [Verrucomicrobiota bacterium]
MQVYLIRHASAEDTAPDHLRRLSKRGREQVRALARFLRRSDLFAPEEIWHSTLVRAQETAALLGGEMKLKVPLREVADLEPGDDPHQFARQLATTSRTIAVVGHEPHLSSLATLLVTGAAEPVRFVMKKGAVLALEDAGPQWAVCWHICPALIE